MNGFIDGCFIGLMVRLGIWYLGFWWNTLKYMVLVVVSIFVGPKKTIERLAASNTIRKVGWLDPDVYKVECIKVTLWMLWATALWIGLIVMIVVASISQNTNLKLP